MVFTFEQTKKIIDLDPFPRPAPFATKEEMTEACDTILKFLLRERGMIAAFSTTYERKRALVRGYMNERAPLPVPGDLIELQNRLFWTETIMRGIVRVADIPEIKYGISLWEGDITRLDADGIVNAANSRLLGCFLPGHNCIDNVIHSFAGMQLRSDCARLMARQDKQEEDVGDAKITRAYNLPSVYVLHTVGPMIGHEPDEKQKAELRSCYTSCLNLAEEAGLNSLAFCCVATGVFNFPHAAAAEIAVGAVVNWKLRHPENNMRVIFNTFLPADTKIYEQILKYI